MKGSRSVRRLSPVAGLLFASLLALLAALPASAQTPTASPGATPQGTPGTLPGLQYAASRQYAPDPTKPISASDEGLFLLTARIFVFDTEAHANAGWDATVNSTTIESQLPPSSEKVQYEEIEIESLGDRAWGVTIAAETPQGDTGYFRLVYVQDGAYLYTLSAIAGSAEPTLITDAFAKAMVDAEPGDGDVEFSPDGTSRGGVWDLMPVQGDDTAGELVAFADSELDLADGDS